MTANESRMLRCVRAWLGAEAAVGRGGREEGLRRLIKNVMAIYVYSDWVLSFIEMTLRVEETVGDSWTVDRPHSNTTLINILSDLFGWIIWDHKKLKWKF